MRGGEFVAGSVLCDGALGEMQRELVRWAVVRAREAGDVQTTCTLALAVGPRVLQRMGFSLMEQVRSSV